MKRFFRSAAVAAAMLAGFVACNNAETEIDTFESSTEEALELTDSASVTISHSIEYLRSFEGGKALCAKINNLILRICLGDEYDGLSFGEASQALMERQVTDYQKEAGEEYKSNPETESYWIYKWSYSVDGKFAESFQDLQTYDVLSDVYLGGAHGMQSMIPHVINLKTGKEVEESELFVEGYEEPVSALIKAALQKEWGSPDDSASAYSEMEEDGMVPNGCFAVSEDGVTWYYQPYVIACYAQGIVEAFVPWDELKPYVNTAVVKL